MNISKVCKKKNIMEQGSKIPSASADEAAICFCFHIGIQVREIITKG